MIFSTGVFLSPKKFWDKNGNEYWGWQVVEFADDSFYNGGIFNPKEFAFSKESLLSENE